MSGRAPLLLPEPGRGGRCPRPGARAGTLSVGASRFVVSGSGLGAAMDSVATDSPRQRRPPCVIRSGSSALELRPIAERCLLSACSHEAQDGYGNRGFLDPLARMCGWGSAESTLARFGPTTPKQVRVTGQTFAHLAIHVPPDGSLAVRAAEMGVTIRCSLAGDFSRETETAEPLTSDSEPWSPPSSLFRHWHGPC